MKSVHYSDYGVILISTIRYFNELQHSYLSMVIFFTLSLIWAENHGFSMIPKETPRIPDIFWSFWGEMRRGSRGRRWLWPWRLPWVRRLGLWPLSGWSRLSYNSRSAEGGRRRGSRSTRIYCKWIYCTCESRLNNSDWNDKGHISLRLLGVRTLT